MRVLCVPHPACAYGVAMFTECRMQIAELSEIVLLSFRTVKTTFVLLYKVFLTYSVVGYGRLTTCVFIMIIVLSGVSDSRVQI